MERRHGLTSEMLPRSLSPSTIKCLRRIMHITKEQQRMRHITSAQVRRWAGMDEALEDLISAKKLCWLGNVSRMEDTRLPKKLLFGWL